MAHHKRRRPKHQRAGCLFCKPWKEESGRALAPALRTSERRRLQREDRARHDQAHSFGLNEHGEDAYG